MLQAPKTGRSRFSKALPSVPGLDDAPVFDSERPPPLPRKSLPQIPPASQPASRSFFAELADTSPPIGSSPTIPLPPPPPSKQPASTTGPKPKIVSIPKKPAAEPPKMLIKRKAVGGSQSSDHTPKPVAVPAAPIPTEAVEMPASPNDSLSSLLSAYSRSSEDLVLRNSDETGSSQGIHIRDFDDLATLNGQMPQAAPAPVPTTTSAPPPESQASPINRADTPKILQPQRWQDSPDAQVMPPPPPKDERRARRPSSPAQAPQPSTTESPTGSGSPIWQRRTNNGSRELPSLKLSYSHGSTAETKPPPIEKEPVLEAAPPPPPSKTPVKISPFPAVPLHTQKPTPSLPSNAIPTPPKDSATKSDTMGSSITKLKHLKDKLSGSSHKSASESNHGMDANRQPAARRPPTPEYQKEDVRTPALETFTSPVSPASSPEPAKDLSLNAKQLPPQPKEASPEAKPSPRTGIPPAAPSIFAARSLPDLSIQTKLEEPRLPSNVQPRRETPSSGSNSDRSRSRTPVGASRSGARDGSARPEGRRPMTNSQTDPRLVRSDSRGELYKGRFGTLYPEMRNLREPDPQAMRFPMPTTISQPEGIIMKALPLRNSHYDCFHRHKYMKRILNRNCPIACQTCEREDVEDRFACSFCNLRICEPCSKGLDEHKRDLRAFMGTHPQTQHSGAFLSLSSDLSSGSALGLQL